jgi:hypothetical protein
MAAAVVLAVAAAASAAPSPRRCASIKAKATGGLVAASLACHAKTTKRGEGDTPACIAAARAKIARLFAKAERKDTCEGDVALIGHYVTTFVDATATALFPAGSLDAARRCAAKKMQRAGAYGRGLLACSARAFASGSAVETGCLAGAASKLNAGFGSAEKKPGCATVGDVATIERALSVFLDPIASLLAPTA